MAHVEDASRAGLAAFLPAGVPRRLAEGGGRLAWSREVTVLFADLTGFTDLCEGLAPDAIAELLSGIFDRMTEVVEAHGGLVDKFLGDACMALFGALDARGDDATCAARAALDLVDAVPAYGRAQAARLRGRPLAVSVGLETGPAFVGVVGERQRTFTAFGDTVNTAARLEALAGPGEVIAGEAAAARLAESLVVRPLAPVALKGKARPQRPVRILRGAPGAGEGISLVGRRAARTAVARGLERAGAVLVAGPPGSGKSALVETLVVPGAVVAPGRAGMPPGDLLARLLAAAGAPVAGDPGPEGLGLLLARVLARRARAGGLLVVTDDLDLASELDRRLLARAIARARGAGGRWLAGATRPELALPEAAAVVRVDLAPLELDAARRLLEARLAAAGVPMPAVADVEQVCRAVGLWPGPLVEAARILAATGGEVPVGGLPEDLDALILARLDRLPGPDRAHLDRWAARTEAARLAGLPPEPGAALAAAPAAPGPAALRAVAGGLAAPARRALHQALTADRDIPPALRLAHRALAGGPQGARAYLGARRLAPAPGPPRRRPGGGLGGPQDPPPDPPPAARGPGDGAAPGARRGPAPHRQSPWRRRGLPDRGPGGRPRRDRARRSRRGSSGSGATSGLPPSSPPGPSPRPGPAGGPTSPPPAGSSGGTPPSRPGTSPAPGPTTAPPSPRPTPPTRRWPGGCA